MIRSIVDEWVEQIAGPLTGKTLLGEGENPYKCGHGGHILILKGESDILKRISYGILQRDPRSFVTCFFPILQQPLAMMICSLDQSLTGLYLAWRNGLRESTFWRSIVKKRWLRRSVSGSLLVVSIQLVLQEHPLLAAFLLAAKYAPSVLL